MYSKEEALKPFYNKHNTGGMTMSDLQGLTKFLALLNVTLRGNVLDLGCGSGATCKIMKNNFDTQVVGVDYSEERIKLAKERHEGIEFINMDMHTFLESTDRTFNVITLFDVIEHLEDPAALIERAKKVLRDDGIIIAKIPLRFPYESHIQVFKDINDVRKKLNPAKIVEMQKAVAASWFK